MCGLTGYINFNSSQERVLNNSDIRNMLMLQQHRGPDDSGIVGINTDTSFYQIPNAFENEHFSESVNLVFGFNRLSIMDVSEKGHQPMFSPDHQVILMMNGEIYNAFEEKDKLLLKGHTFLSGTDTEVVLHLYMEYGFEGMIKRLNGMFAIVLYDFRLQCLFLARDRFGIKPLYILKEKHRIAFSSEIKSFKALPNFAFELDTDQIDEFLLFRNIIHNTLFKNIFNFQPGTFWKVKADGNIQSHTYYDINEEGNQLISEKDALDCLNQSLGKSVQSQLMSDVKLGCQLSGGVDSSLVAYYASKYTRDDQLDAISIIFKDSKYSEKKYIDYVTEQLHLKSHQYVMEPNYFFSVFLKAVWHFEQPLNHPNSVGIYFLSQEAKKHVKVLLSGEGADELLAGYKRFMYSESKWHAFKKSVQGLKNNHRHGFDYIKNCMGFDNAVITATTFNNLNSAGFVYPAFNTEKALLKRKNIFNKLEGEKLLKQRKYEMLTYLPDLLMRQDKMSMAHSIENRVPFLDNDMVRTSFNLPLTSLIGKREGRQELKLILKQLYANHFSHEYAFRPKMGFAIPLQTFMDSKWFSEKWQDEMYPSIQKRGIFSLNKRFDLQKTKETSSHDLEILWLMNGFETWAKLYLD